MLKITKSMGLALCLATAWQSQNSSAQESQSSQLAVVQQPTYSLQDAVNMTLKQHPELKPFALREQINKGLIRQAQVGTAMTIEANVTDVLGTGDYSALSGVQTEVGIGWLLEQTQLEAKTEVAKTKSQLNSLDRQIKAIDLAAKTASDYVVLLAQKEQLKLAKLQQMQASKMLSDIKERVAVGQVSKIDQLRAKADLASKALVVEDFVHEIEASKSLIASQWLGTGNFQANGSLSKLPKLLTFEQITTQLKANPMFEQYTAKQRVTESQIALAEVENQPAWRVTTGIKHNQAINDFAFTAGIEVPLGSPDRNIGKIQALQAQQLEIQAQANALENKLATQLLLLTHKLKHNSHVVEGLVEEIIPALQDASKQAEIAYLKGNYRYSDWYAIEQELNSAQRELIDAYTNIHLFNIELQRLTGTPFTSGSSL